MSLAHELERARYVPESLDVAVSIVLERQADTWKLSRSEIDVVANVPNIDERTLAELAERANAACIVSRALAKDVAIHVTSALSSQQLAASAGP
jgi:osmotically inducible protein OsmC